MFSKIVSCGIRGVEGYQVAIETDISSGGLPSLTMVGYLSEEVREAQERVRTALRNSGFLLPPRRITINLSPAGLRKDGTAFDLAIAVSILCCLEDELSKTASQAVFLGELGLNGEIKPVNGMISRVYYARQAGFSRCFVPRENVKEGTVVEGVEIVGVSNLLEQVELLRCPDRIKGQWFDGKSFEKSLKQRTEAAVSSQTGAEEAEAAALDYADICGQTTVKRAMETAAAGRHSCLLIGPAGTGKTMAARRLPSILPPITLEESIEVSKIYSICGLLPKDLPLITERPFRAPHHSITAQSLAGGGRNPRPGEISLASGGVLFLDELTEFPGRILDLLRQPLEEKRITVTRLSGILEFPADCMLICAMNPCLCGKFPSEKCTCSESQIRRYLGKVSGPFLDRIDIGVEVPPVPCGELRGTARAGEKRSEESSAAMRKRVEKARNMQEKRFAGLSIRCNSEMGPAEIREFCSLLPEDEAFLMAVYRQYGFSARGFDKILKVARTVADLDGADQIGRIHLCEAVSYRSFEKKYWGAKK
ncbi:MAG: YifB family Mg chelatase-like AAA ATPase [Clostridium sp.]